MRKLFAILTALTLIYPAHAKTSYTLFKPEKFGKVVKIAVKGKHWKYCQLDRKNPMEFTVEGPAELKFISRLNMDSYNAGQKVDYKILCKIDDKPTHFTRSALLSKGVSFAKGGKAKIGNAQEFSFTLEKGTHKVKLFLDRSDKSIIYVRPLKAKKQVSTEIRRTAINPRAYTKEVKILVKEKEFDYFRIGAQDSLKLEVIGPSSIKAFSRLEYDNTMNGEKKYRLQVYEDNKLKNTFLLNTIISETAIYAQPNTNKLLSRADDFFIEVPKGVHSYSFKVLDCGRTALMKFYIPEKDLKNTP